MPYHCIGKRNEKCAVIAPGKKKGKKKKKRQYTASMEKLKSFMGWTSKHLSLLLVDDPHCGSWKLKR